MSDEPIRTWAGSPYCRIYYSIVERMGDLYFDDPAFAGWVRLLIAADAAFPLPAPLPRWLTDDVLDRLVEAGLVRLVGAGSYAVAGLARERADRDSGRAVGGRARAESAQRNPDGTFASNETTNGRATASSHQQSDQQPEPASPAVQLEQETRRARDEQETRRDKRGDSLASKPARSRPGSTRARRQDNRKLMDEYAAAQPGVEPSKKNGADPTEPCIDCGRAAGHALGCPVAANPALAAVNE